MKNNTNKANDKFNNPAIRKWVMLTSKRCANKISKENWYLAIGQEAICPAPYEIISANFISISDS